MRSESSSVAWRCTIPKIPIPYRKSSIPLCRLHAERVLERSMEVHHPENPHPLQKIPHPPMSPPCGASPRALHGGAPPRKSPSPTEDPPSPYVASMRSESSSVAWRCTTLINRVQRRNSFDPDRRRDRHVGVFEIDHQQVRRVRIELIIGPASRVMHP